MQQGNCKSCGADIVWIRTSSGKAMPLDCDPRKVVVIRKGVAGNSPIGDVVDGYTSHFATCPNANEHRNS